MRLYAAGKDTRYDRYIDLKVVGPDDKVLWQVSLDSVGTSHNYVKTIPRMLVAGLNYYGSAFEGKKKEIILPEESELIRKIRGPLFTDSDDERSDANLF